MLHVVALVFASMLGFVSSPFASDVFEGGTFSLYSFNAAPGKKGALRLPRTYAPLYRGMTGKQFDLSRALRALFGDSLAGIETKTLTAIKSVLMNKPSPVFADLKTRGYQAEIDRYWARYGRDPLSEENALALALKIMDKQLSAIDKETLASQFFRYSSYDYLDWPSEMVYATSYYIVSKTYGTMIAVMKDIHHRGLDVNWLNGTMPLIQDSGEYLFPEHIAADEVYGYHLTDGVVKGVAMDTHLRYTQEAFYRVNAYGKRFVLVFGADSDCLTLENGLVYECFHPERSVYGFTAWSDFPVRRAQAMPKAILALCPLDAPCSVPPELFKKHRVSPRPLDKPHLNVIVNQRVLGQAIKVFYRPRVLSAKDMVAL